MVELSIQLPEGYLDEETRNGYLVTKKYKELWAVEIDLLEKVKEVCNKYNLSFFADSGTLLGAIRDNGFIPWDDDIDIIMLRKDYDQLLKVASEEFGDPYFLQTAYSDNAYCRGHAQLRNTRTTAIVQGEKNKEPFNQGIFLDIFPLDFVPKTFFLRKRKIRIKSWIFRRLHSLFTTEQNGDIKKKIKNMIARHYKSLFHVYDWVCKTNILKSNDVSKVLMNYGKNVKEKGLRFFPSEWLGKSKEVPFEFTTIPIPEKYDCLLKMYYGENYMTPAKAPSAHGEMFFNTDLPIDQINRSEYDSGAQI